MNPGLVFLLRHKPIGWGRAVRRRIRGIKGALLALGVLLLLALMIGPQLFLAAQMTDESLATSVAALRLWGPAALMVMVLFGISSGSGLLFRQSEIDFLFPAPIGRRELLLYHVLSRLSGLLLSSLWIFVFTLRWAPRWYGGLVGVFLALMFLQLISQLAALVLASWSVRSSQWGRRLAVVGTLAVGAFAVWLVRQQMPQQATLADAAEELVSSTVVSVAAVPARVFVEIFAAPAIVPFALWTAAGLAILGGLFVLTVRVDVSYSEAAMRASRRVQDRLRRMRAGGGAIAAPASGSVRFSLPRVPWLGGAGPMIWRQGAEALRNAGSLVKIALVTVGVPGVMVVVLAAGDGEQGLGPGPFACIMVLAMTLFMTQNLALDFRRDLDRMAYLKSLPLPAQALALGQILPAIGVFTVLQLLAFAIIVLVFGVALPFPAPMLLLLVLFNWLLMALDNVLFLWFPYRFVPNEAGNVQFLGRLMMFSFARLFAFAAALGMAAASGWLGWWWGGESIWLAGLGAVGMLTILAIGLTCLLGSAFRHFDLTRDVPG